MTTEKSPLVLLILDGFGYSDDPKYNAIAGANAPVWEKLWSNNPKTLIHTSGLSVGLPDGQMGNSEVGHMTLGAGRVVYQNFTRINKAISDGDFFTNPVFCDAIDKAVASNKAVPPPGTIPASTAARVAFSASSTRSLRSFTSTSVAPPTFSTATPPANLATRSCSFSRS